MMTISRMRTGWASLILYWKATFITSSRGILPVCQVVNRLCHQQLTPRVALVSGKTHFMELQRETFISVCNKMSVRLLQQQKTWEQKKYQEKLQQTSTWPSRLQMLQLLLLSERTELSPQQLGATWPWVGVPMSSSLLEFSMPSHYSQPHKMKQCKQNFVDQWPTWRW